MLQDRPLKRLSICPCGETLLNDEIKLGHVYSVDLDIVRTATYACGACGKKFQINCSPVMQTEGDEAGSLGWMPNIVFIEPTQKIKERTCSHGGRRSQERRQRA